MSWLVLTIIVIVIAGVSLWLNAKFNKHALALNEREQRLNQREIYLKQEEARHKANLDERLKQAQIQDAELKQRDAQLEHFAKWLKEQDIEMDKKYKGIKVEAEAAVKKAHQERDAARQRANRLQEKLDALEGKPKKTKQDSDIQSVAT